MRNHGEAPVSTLPASVGATGFAIPAAAVARVGRDWVCTPPPPGMAPWIAGIADGGDGEPILALRLHPSAAQEPASRRVSLVVVRDGHGDPEAFPFGVVVDAVGGFSSAHDPVTQTIRVGGCPGDWFRLWRGADGRLVPVLDPAAVGRALAAPWAGGPP